MPTALLVDDDVSFRTALSEVVREEGFTVTMAETLAEAREALRRELPDLALLDLMLPDGTGLELLPELQETTTEVVLITGNATVDTAVEALRRGAADYLSKPVDLPRLRALLVNVARRRDMRQEIESLRTELRSLGHFGPLIGGVPAMQRV